MNHNPGEHPRSERLSDYLDGGLTSAEHDTVAAHLAVCAACAATLAGIETVRERARALPRIAAPAEVWEGLAPRLAALRAPILDLAAERSRRWSFSTPQLAAAAAALMVVSATGAWFVGQRVAPQGAPLRPEPIAAVVTSRPLPDSSAALAPPAGSSQVEAEPGRAIPARNAAATGSRGATAATAATEFGLERYDSAIADLERILAENRGRLNPATIQVVEKNLALIDRAIEDARRALAADPASRYLNDHLAQNLRRKVDLLRRVTYALQS